MKSLAKTNRRGRLPISSTRPRIMMSLLTAAGLVLLAAGDVQAQLPPIQQGQITVTLQNFITSGFTGASAEPINATRLRPLCISSIP
jgi:hypothetical protein